MAKRKFDLVVLGTGPAGSSIIYRCRDEGLSVAVIESGSPGGTCSQTGCDAKKPLVNAAELIDWYRRMQGKGISGDGRINWQELINFKRSFTDPISDSTREKLTKYDISLFEGQPSFLDKNTIQVEGELITGKNIVIATGSRPKDLNIPGEEMVTKSDQFMELDELPERIVFIGGGYVSFEFAHVASRAGVDVTIVERNERFLEDFDQQLVELLVEASSDHGIKVERGKCVDSVKKTSDQLLVGCNEGEVVFNADMLVHGAGRMPSIDKLDLAKANIDFSPDGILVNEHLQSISNPSVYAAGDVSATEGLPLTPTANLEGAIVADNLLGNNSRKVDYSGIPTALFTIPSLASVGLTEEQAEERGLKFSVNYENTGDKKLFQQLGAHCSAYKAILEKRTDRIIGAHILAPDAYEVINIFAMAMRLGLSSAKIKDAVFTYPSKAATAKWVL